MLFKNSNNKPSAKAGEKSGLLKHKSEKKECLPSYGSVCEPFFLVHQKFTTFQLMSNYDNFVLVFVSNLFSSSFGSVWKPIFLLNMM